VERASRPVDSKHTGETLVSQKKILKNKMNVRRLQKSYKRYIFKLSRAGLKFRFYQPWPANPRGAFGAGFDFGISGWLPGSWLVVVAAEAGCFGRIFPQIGRRLEPATGTIFRKILTSLSSWK
jgi:hypothetical protein